MTPINKQQGSVLVIAVLFTSVIVALAARFSASFQLDFARAEHYLVATQLQHYQYSAEAFAQSVLVADGQDDNDNGLFSHYDHYKENWGKTLDVPVGEANISAVLKDAGSYYNLNQLAGRPSPYNPDGNWNERFTPQQQRFIRLLQAQPDGLVSRTLAEEITEAVIDWIDTDDKVTGLGGAESQNYQGQSPPYYAADQQLQEISELRQIKSMTAEIYQYLAPLVVALPNQQGININTASAAILRSLNQQGISDPLDSTLVEALVSQQPQADASTLTATTTAFESVTDFLASTAAGNAFGTHVKFLPSTEGLRTGSDIFILQTQIEMREYKRRYTSLLQRQKNADGIQVRIIRRNRTL